MRRLRNWPPTAGNTSGWCCQARSEKEPCGSPAALLLNGSNVRSRLFRLLANAKRGLSDLDPSPKRHTDTVGCAPQRRPVASDPFFFFPGTRPPDPVDDSESDRQLVGNA